MAEELQPKGSAGEDPLGSRRSRHMAASGAGLAADRELAEMPRMVSQTPMSAYVSSVARVAGPILAVALAAGCQAAPPSPSPMGAQPPLSISNGTTIAVTLVVNGKVVEMVGPGDRDDPISTALPGAALDHRNPVAGWPRPL